MHHSFVQWQQLNYFPERFLNLYRQVITFNNGKKYLI